MEYCSPDSQTDEHKRIDVSLLFMAAVRVCVCSAESGLDSV